MGVGRSRFSARLSARLQAGRVRPSHSLSSTNRVAMAVATPVFSMACASIHHTYTSHSGTCMEPCTSGKPWFHSRCCMHTRTWAMAASTCHHATSPCMPPLSVHNRGCPSTHRADGKCKGNADVDLPVNGATGLQQNAARNTSRVPSMKQQAHNHKGHDSMQAGACPRGEGCARVVSHSVPACALHAALHHLIARPQVSHLVSAHALGKQHDG
jgi:hypothetical protein